MMSYPYQSVRPRRCIVFLGLLALLWAVPAESQSTDELTQKLQEISHAAGGNYALYYKNLSTGFTFELNTQTPYPAASVIKIPLVVSLYTLLDIGSLPSQQTLRVTKRDRVGGTGVLQGRKTPFELTLQEAVKLTLNKSDNIATNVLIDFVTPPAVNHRMKRMGYPSILLNRKMVQKAPPENWMNAHDMGRLLEKVALNMILIPKGFESVIDIMRRAPKGNKLGELLPDGVSLARKGGRLLRHMHDAAILSAGGQTVVIVSMVSAFKSKKKAARSLHRTGQLIYDHLLKSATPNTPGK